MISVVFIQEPIIIPSSTLSEQSNLGKIQDLKMPISDWYKSKRFRRFQVLIKFHNIFLKLCYPDKNKKD